jgi:hypothetical protein
MAAGRMTPGSPFRIDGPTHESIVERCLTPRSTSPLARVVPSRPVIVSVA